MENRSWGAKRIRGELLKLGIEVAKSTIQRYVSQWRSTPTGPALVDVPAQSGGWDLLL